VVKRPEPVKPDLDLHGVRGRDPVALGALFDRYFDRMFGLVYRMLGDRSSAEDAIQEIFLKVYRGAGSLDPDRDPGPWLMTIATNVCRDHWRSSTQRMARASRSIDAEPGAMDALADGTHDPERAFLASERAAQVQAALLRLSPPLREVILLREYEGLDYRQIAAITATHEPAVRKRYSRALAQLEALLTQKEP
jgi:RNA polymerase sigma-70 factor (ECF subfamily)